MQGHVAVIAIIGVEQDEFLLAFAAKLQDAIVFHAVAVFGILISCGNQENTLREHGHYAMLHIARVPVIFHRVRQPVDKAGLFFHFPQQHQSTVMGRLLGGKKRTSTVFYQNPTG